MILSPLIPVNPASFSRQLSYVVPVDRSWWSRCGSAVAQVAPLIAYLFDFTVKLFSSAVSIIRGNDGPFWPHRVLLVWNYLFSRFFFLAVPYRVGGTILRPFWAACSIKNSPDG